MEQNIRIAYALSFLKNSWFWLGIWMLFYLKFTNYAGIGLLETILVLSIIISEIPTGAIADLLGKKITLIISFALETIGIYIMAVAPQFATLGLGVFIAGIGGSFYSGTLEALVYDTLKENGKKDQYDKTISNITTLSLFAPAVCGAIGGYLYSINNSWPFIASSFATFIGLILCLFLKEPSIDTEKFSINVYINQLKQGVHELFKSYDLARQTLLLLSIGAIIAISDEMLDGIISFEFGYNEIQLGILWSIILLVASITSQTTPFLNRRLKKNSLLFTGIIIAITLIASPVAGMILGASTLLLRSSFQAIFTNLTSVALNEKTESKYRATTISTYNTLRYIPYVLLAFSVGALSDIYTAKIVAMVLGFFIIIGLIIQYSFKTKQSMQ